MKISDHYSDRVMSWQRAQGFPWHGLRFAEFSEPFVLDSGEVLPTWRLAFEEWGEPGAHPTVVILHALTGDTHITSHCPGDRRGWWENLVGLGCALDTGRYHLLAANVLGGAMGSTGPSSSDPAGRPWGSRFPTVSLDDMARALHHLLSAMSLGPVILVGGSMGGMMALAYALRYGAEVAGVLAIGSPISHGPWAIAYHTVGRMAVRQDPAFLGGDYYDGVGPEQGLQLARMTDMISYQSPGALDAKFGRRLQPGLAEDFQVASYLRYQGRKMFQRFDANTYLCLTEALDRADLHQADWSLATAVPTELVGISTDMLYLPDAIQADVAWLQQQGVPAQYRLLTSPFGHDSFLVDQNGMRSVLSDFLDRLPQS